MINNKDLHCVLRILELRTEVLNLNLKQIEQGGYEQTKKLKALAHKLSMFYKGITKYDFVSKIKEGNTHQEESRINDYSKFATYEFKI